MSQSYEVIIVGGSIAGLSAALTLGRSLRNILVIDSGSPCNLQTPRSHNFITQDGSAPCEIASRARLEVEKYPTVTFLQDTAVDASKTESCFTITTASGTIYEGERVLLATGLTDILPDVPGFKECWGISILHCPYCHGYEVKGMDTAIYANGLAAYHLGVLLNNWTPKITILTDGTPDLTEEQQEKLNLLNIKILDTKIAEIAHEDRNATYIIFADGTKSRVEVLYASVPFRQKSDLARKLGCEFTEKDHIVVDNEHRTTVEGMYAAGDATAEHRAISVAAASGTRAGFTINVEAILKR